VSVTVFSPNDISGLRRPKDIEFGTEVASSTRMMHAVRFFWKKFFKCGKICKKSAKNKHVILHNAEIGTNIAHGVRMMPKLCIALILNCSRIFNQNMTNSKKCQFLFHSHGGTTETQTVYTWRHHVSGFNTHYLRQCGALRTL